MYSLFLKGWFSFKLALSGERWPKRHPVPTPVTRSERRPPSPLRVYGRSFHIVVVALTGAVSILLWTLVASHSVLSAQPVIFTIRPTMETAVELVLNPQHARDTNELSAAGGVWGRVCSQNCLNPIVATATWQRIPGGYRPLALEVKWRAVAITNLYGSDAAEIKSKLEYDLGAGWQSWIEYTWFTSSGNCPSPSDGSILCSDHVDTLPLLPTHRTDQIKVRVTESVRMTLCHNCWIRISGANGALNVFDIRV